AKGAKRWVWAVARGGVAALLGAACVGCGNQSEEPADPPKAPALAVQNQPERPPEKSKAAAAGPRLHHPFAQAGRPEPPDGQDRPADTTFTGKPTGKLFEAVQKAWDAIRFTTPEGKRIAYTAVLETAEGPVTIELRPDLAPNHVRNFVALARAGY